VGGLTAAFAVASALFSARQTGTGRFLDVSMLESTLATMGWVVSNYLNAGVTPAPMGNAHFTAAPSGTFRTGEGLINIAANEDKQYAALCEVVGRPDLKSDDRFVDRHARKVHRAALTVELEAVSSALYLSDMRSYSKAGAERTGTPPSRTAAQWPLFQASARIADLRLKAQLSTTLNACLD
jgi:crotonobetainyl-CoA:carnitine CoA-transferase CaiB-like acyl-CoA transferase